MTKRAATPRALALCALLAAAGCAPAGRGAAGAEGTVPVGVAVVDITPGEPIRLAGYAERRTPADSVAQRLRATAIAFGDDGEGPAVLVTTDLIGVPLQVTEEVARRLERAGVRRENVVVTAYANDVSFYVASRRLRPEGGYEVEQSMIGYGQPSRLAPETEDLIVRAVHDIVPRAFARERAP